MILYLLAWGCIGGVLPCLLTAHSIFTDRRMRLWWKIAIGFFCGPPMWAVVLFAALLGGCVGAIAKIRANRAKKTAKP